MTRIDRVARIAGRPSAIAVRPHRSVGVVLAGAHTRAVGRFPHSRSVGYRLASIAP